jgi:hypothetical protein
MNLSSHRLNFDGSEEVACSLQEPESIGRCMPLVLKITKCLYWDYTSFSATEVQATRLPGSLPQHGLCMASM